MSSFDLGVQQFCIQFKALIYTCNSIEICFQLPLSVFYVYLAYRGLTFYGANSFNLSLLITNGLFMFFYSFATFFYLITVVKVIKADESELNRTVSLNSVAVEVQWWLALFSSFSYWVTHWIFAFKYWTLALKV